MKQRSIADKFYLFLKGLAMGAANKVPGVSGGAISFVLGFYEELIYSLKKVNYTAFKLLFAGRFKSFFAYTNASFLTLVFTGSVFSYFSISLILDYFLKYYELYVWSWFFGLIIGSIYFIAKDFGKWQTQSILFLMLGITIGVSISLLTPAKENDNLWFVFLCGIIGVSGMTLPGLSGSFILMLLGNYVLLLVDSVNELLIVITSIFTGNFEILQDPIKIRYLKIIGVFTAGSAFGLVAISHLLAYVLKRYHQLVVASIIGFIAGSLGNVWPWKTTVFAIQNNEFLVDKKGNKIVENYERYLPNIAELETWIAIFWICVGIAIILVIDNYGKKNN